MSKLIIKNNGLPKVKCLKKINNKCAPFYEVSRNETKILDMENIILIFKCSSMGYFSSTECEINLLNNNVAEIETAIKMGKWQCEIKYYDEVPENAIKQIEIQEKKNNNEKVRTDLAIQKQEEQKSLANIFVVTNKVGEIFYIDETNKLWTIPEGIISKKINPNRIHHYSDIVSYELLEDGTSISKGGVGRAIVGGALFGGVGAIVGGSTGHKQQQMCTSLKLKITLKDINCPIEYIEFVYSATKKTGWYYQGLYSQAQAILSYLDIICKENSQQQVEILNNTQQRNIELKSIPDEIKKYKELLDIGAITQEEYEAKKKQLLNL